MTPATRIALALGALGLDRAELAERLGVGIDSLHPYLGGHRSLERARGRVALERVAEALGVPVGVLREGGPCPVCSARKARPRSRPRFAKPEPEWSGP